MKNFRNESELTHHLIKKRVSKTPELNMDESTIDSLEGMMLAGMPESTIVAIVELYVRMKEADISDKEIFQQFEQMRSGSGKMPSPLNLNSYINYRLRLEHVDGIGLTNEFTTDAIKASYNYFNTQKTEAQKKNNSNSSFEQVNNTKNRSDINLQNKKSTKIGSSTSEAVFQTIGMIFGFMVPFILAGLVADATDSGAAAVITFVISLVAYFILLKNRD